MSDEQQARPAPKKKIADTPRARHYQRATAVYDCVNRLREALERVPGDPYLSLLYAQLEASYQHLPKEPETVIMQEPST